MPRPGLPLAPVESDLGTPQPSKGMAWPQEERGALTPKHAGHPWTLLPVLLRQLGGARKDGNGQAENRQKELRAV